MPASSSGGSGDVCGLERAKIINKSYQMSLGDTTTPSGHWQPLRTGCSCSGPLEKGFVAWCLVNSKLIAISIVLLQWWRLATRWVSYRWGKAGISFASCSWDRSWILWPVLGVINQVAWLWLRPAKQTGLEDVVCEEKLWRLGRRRLEVGMWQWCSPARKGELREGRRKASFEGVWWWDTWQWWCVTVKERDKEMSFSQRGSWNAGPGTHRDGTISITGSSPKFTRMRPEQPGLPLKLVLL